jgi:tRNA (guanine9-N1)-methyltransferase
MTQTFLSLFARVHVHRRAEISWLCGARDCSLRVLSLSVVLDDPATVMDTTDTAADAPVPAPMSKKAMKKAAKVQRHAETKHERRAAEKDRRRARKRALADKRAAGDALDSDEEALLVRARKRRRLGRDKDAREPFAARVVVDLGFDAQMTDKVRPPPCEGGRVLNATAQEVKSLTAQIAYVYAANRRAITPFERVLFTKLGGRTGVRMDETTDGGYARWDGCDWWEQGYEDLWRPSTPPSHDAAPGADEDQSAAGPSESAAGHSDPPQDEDGRSRTPQTSIVYLTADSPDELTELRPDETYIIGGIVDRNRYKVNGPP